jgi:hypothetical protein
VKVSPLPLRLEADLPTTGTNAARNHQGGPQMGREIRIPTKKGIVKIRVIRG